MRSVICYFDFDVTTNVLFYSENDANYTTILFFTVITRHTTQYMYYFTVITRHTTQ